MQDAVAETEQQRAIESDWRSMRAMQTDLDRTRALLSTTLTAAPRTPAALPTAAARSAQAPMVATSAHEHAARAFVDLGTAHANSVQCQPVRAAGDALAEARSIMAAALAATPAGGSLAGTPERRCAPQPPRTTSAAALRRELAALVARTERAGGGDSAADAPDADAARGPCATRRRSPSPGSTVARRTGATRCAAGLPELRSEGRSPEMERRTPHRGGLRRRSVSPVSSLASRGRAVRGAAELLRSGAEAGAQHSGRWAPRQPDAPVATATGRGARGQNNDLRESSSDAERADRLRRRRRLETAGGRSGSSHDDSPVAAHGGKRSRRSAPRSAAHDGGRGPVSRRDLVRRSSTHACVPACMRL